MKTTLNHSLSWGLLMALMGCDASSSRPAAPILAAPPAHAAKGQEAQANETVTHPEFANWSRFPSGTSVVREREVVNSFGTVRVTTRLWLEDKQLEKVIVGSQITVARPGQPLEKNPENLTTYPSEFKLPAGIDKEVFDLPNPEANLAGKESIEIDGHTFDADVYEWKENNEAGPMTVKVWHSPEVPGRIARQEMLTLSSQTSVTETIVSLVLGDAN